MRWTKLIPFFSLVLIYIIAGAYLLITYPKGDFELIVNQNHKDSFDLFFKNYTHLGDGLFYALIMALLLLYKYYYVLVGTVAVLLKTTLVHIGKQILFDDHARPLIFFRDKFIDVNFVDGVEMAHFNSFPSGHTATAFCLATFLVLMLTKEQKPMLSLWQLLLFTYALLVGISRFYLLQHFFEDTYAGTLLGFICALLVFLIFEKTQLYKNKFLSRSVLSK
ncbi:MAG: phosphatase PAP2 family protein [Bacteroidota bacterium]|nr:phosphatase PAP2 family protein [Bacteroidota bacterium]